METIDVLRREEAKLQNQLSAVRGAIQALNGHTNGSAAGTRVSRPRRSMSAAARARISKATKARWARFRADTAKGKKA